VGLACLPKIIPNNSLPYVLVIPETQPEKKNEIDFALINPQT